MSARHVIQPFEVFRDVDGTPLESGSIYIGIANLDPVANPIPVFWDEALTIAAAQPITTINGYPSRSGSPGRLFCNDDYSILVRNKRGELVFGAPVITASGDTLRADLANTADPAKGDAMLGVKSVLTGAVPRTQHDKNSDIVSFFDFGAVGGSTDDTAACQAAINAIGAAGGGVIDGGMQTYCIDSSNGLKVDYDNVFIVNSIFKRTVASNTGFTLAFADSDNTNGGGVVNCKFIGIADSTAIAGLRMGTDTYKASNYIIDNVEAISHSQYGVGIEAGDGWKISNVRVLEHGLTSGVIASCIGFYVYPRIASEGGQLSNVYSRISDGCVANASANTAAIKLQTHKKMTATGISAIYGSEQALSIDSVDGLISVVFVKQQGNNAGLAVGNYSTAHIFSGQTFTLDGFIIENGGTANNNEFVISGGTDGQYSLTGCTIKNGSCGGAGYLALSNTKNCLFENLYFQDIRFSSAYRSFTVNSAASLGNTYRNINVTGGVMVGVCALETTRGVIAGLNMNAVEGDSVGTFELYGSENLVVSPMVRNSSSNAIKVTGDSNEFFNVSLVSITGRSIWFPSGSDNNRVHSGDLIAGTGVLDSGSGNYIYTANRIQSGGAAPVSGTWSRGDIFWNTAPSAGGSVGWVCTTAGTPGTWKTFGAIAT